MPTIDTIQSNHDLRAVAAEIVECLFSETREQAGEDLDLSAYEDEMRDRLAEQVDSSPHVIYTSRAVALCANCDTSEGEELLEDLYGAGKIFTGCASFGEVCARLAYACLTHEAELALQELIDAWAEAHPTEG